MTNKTEMVSVPRELLECFADSNQHNRTLGDLTHWAREILARHDASPVEDARAVVDEPVAWLVEAADANGTVRLSTVARIQWTAGNRDMDEWAAGRTVTNTPLYRHPQRPVVMPEFETFQKWMADSQFEHTPYWAWRLCLDEFARLNPQ